VQLNHHIYSQESSNFPDHFIQDETKAREIKTALLRIY
jgi:hypothetical protein